MSTTTWPITLAAEYLVVLFLMVARTGALLLSAPIFGARVVPPANKIALAIALSVLLLPNVVQRAVVPPTFSHLLLAIGKEIAIGLLAGFVVTMLYGALQMAASFASVQIGFGFSSTVDTTFTEQTPVLDHLFTGLATLIFLSANFHHQFLAGIQGLFDAVPPNTLALSQVSPDGLVALSTQMFIVAVRIVLPLLAALLLTEIALGIMSRTAPQMNVFFVGMPVKIAIGIFAIIVMLPFVVNVMELLFGGIARDMTVILHYR